MASSRPSINEFTAKLRAIVGRRHVLTSPRATRPYCEGYRSGDGPVAAVVRPGSLIELWRLVRLCVEADAIVIMQAANTGLTGGSTPDGNGYDRPVVLVSSSRLAGIRPLNDGREVVCLPGASLYELEAVLRPIGREPHSVIGSSCIGASVIGGICNNSGGALVRRGPAYTELALFARLGADGTLELVNNLGIELPAEPEAALNQLERGSFALAGVQIDTGRSGSDEAYCDHVRDVEASTPARFNADPRRLRDASGSAGRVIVFAVRLDTFPADAETATFYLGTNDPTDFAALRRHMLINFAELPVTAEYIHKTAFDLAATYGKDTVLMIERLGTDRLPTLFGWKRTLDTLAERLGAGKNFGDRFLQRVSRWLPGHLPDRMTAFRDRYEHHLILKVAGPGIAQARTYLSSEWNAAQGGHFECDAAEAAKAFLHRFAVAGAAVRYRAVHAAEIEGIIALDIALPRNTIDWFERLPVEIESAIVHKLYYGHFFCHVFHQDYLVRKGRNLDTLEHAMLNLLRDRGAKFPAEHNVGQLYEAEPVLADFYKSLDPLNQFNPGLGKTSKERRWGNQSL